MRVVDADPVPDASDASPSPSTARVTTSTCMAPRVDPNGFNSSLIHARGRA